MLDGFKFLVSPVENSEMLCCAVLKFISEIAIGSLEGYGDLCYVDLMYQLLVIVHVNVRSFSHSQSQT